MLCFKGLYVYWEEPAYDENCAIRDFQLEDYIRVTACRDEVYSGSAAHSRRRRSRWRSSQ